MVEALYRTEVEELTASAGRLAKEQEPLFALRSWLLLFVDYFSSKRIIIPVLQALVGPTASVFQDSTSDIRESVRRLYQATVDAEDITPGIEAVDLLRALTGVLSIAPHPQSEASARQLIDVLLQGMKQPKSAKHNCEA